MRLVSPSCPNCHATLVSEDGFDSFSCPTCGYRQSAEAKINMKDAMDKPLFMSLRATVLAEGIHKKASRKAIFCALALVVVTFLLVSIFASAEITSKRQEAELQSIVEQVKEDISAGDLALAYETAQTIHYTAGRDRELVKKWDNIREGLLTRIEKEREKETESGSDTFEHEP